MCILLITYFNVRTYRHISHQLEENKFIEVAVYILNGPELNIFNNKSFQNNK